MDIKPTSYRYDGEGIECAYRNEKWVVCIKNWKPNNDIDGLEHLEIHHTTCLLYTSPSPRDCS